MIKEEQILKSRYGTQSSFRVPEGYFDELASRVMASVPESQPALDMQSESASQGARIVPMWRTLLYVTRTEERLHRLNIRESVIRKENVYGDNFSQGN